MWIAIVWRVPQENGLMHPFQKNQVVAPDFPTRVSWAQGVVLMAGLIVDTYFSITLARLSTSSLTVSVIIPVCGVCVEGGGGPGSCAMKTHAGLVSCQELPWQWEIPG